MGASSSKLAVATAVEILDSCLPSLVRYFARLTGDVMLAEDLVQEAAVVVLERPQVLARLGNPEGYCFGIVRRLYLGQLRKAQRRATFATAIPPEVYQAPDVADEVADEVADRCQQRWLTDLISRLPARRDRALLERVLTYGQDKASICEALGLSSRHYDRVLHRATLRLRAQVRKQTVLTEYKTIV